MEEALETLVGMGFHPDSVRQALEVRVGPTTCELCCVSGELGGGVQLFEHETNLHRFYAGIHHHVCACVCVC